MLYFAYGSNLDPDQMTARCPAHRVVGLAELRDYRLVFPRYSESWEGASASVQLAHGQSVWGLLYELSDEDMAAADSHEGFHAPGDPANVYDREPMWVELTRPEDGSVPRRVRAAVYVSRPANPPPLNTPPPSRRYLDTILRGARARGLPGDYIEKLSRTAVGEASST
jgi:hypothetical protein